MTIFEKNMEVISARYPDMVDKIKPAPHVKMITTRYGLPSIAVEQEGKTTHLHSLIDPSIDAASDVERDAPNTGTTRFWLILGMGCGYHLKALYAYINRYQMPMSIAIVESDPAIVHAALSSLDLTTELKDGRVVLFVASDPKIVIDQVYHYFIALSATVVAAIKNYRELALDPTYYAKVSEEILGLVNGMRVCYATTMKRGKEFQQNIFTNMPTYFDSPDLGSLIGKFNNIPAFIVAAGPSLPKNVAQLKEVKNKGLLFVVDTAIVPVLNAGIVPQFVVALDATALKLKNFEDTRLKDSCLIALPQVHPDVLKAFPGKKMLVSQNPITLAWIDAIIGKKHTVPGDCLTVAHLAYYSARDIGCSPLVFVGQDLSFTIGGRTHSEGVVGATMREKVEATEPGIVYVDGLNGQKVPTYMNLAAFLRTFEAEFVKNPRHVLNATEGGAIMAGAPNMLLKEVIDKFCVNEYDEAMLASLIVPCSPDVTKLRQLKNDIYRKRAAYAKKLESLKESQALTAEFRRKIDLPDRNTIELDKLLKERDAKHNFIAQNSAGELALLLQLFLEANLKGQPVHDIAIREKDPIKRSKLIADELDTIQTHVIPVIEYFDSELERLEAWIGSR